MNPVKKAGLITVGAAATGVVKTIEGLQFVGRKTKQGTKAVARSPRKVSEKVSEKVMEHKALSAFEERARQEKIDFGLKILVVSGAEGGDSK